MRGGWHRVKMPAGSFLDLGTWPRRTHYEFYLGYDYPFFNVCTDVPVTTLYRRAREPGGPSFFLATLYLSLRAANQQEEFRLRLRDGGVWQHDRVHAGSTVLRPDQTFAFAHFDFVDSYREFEERGRATIAKINERAPTLEAEDRDDEIYFSVLPWIRFTSFVNPRPSPAESVPKVVFGKHFERDGERWMPVSIEVHHALVDGLHVGRFLERLEAELRGLSL